VLIALLFLWVEALFPKSEFRATEYYVNQITLTGNTHFSTRKLKRQINLKEKTFWRMRTFTRRLLELDRLTLESIYVKQGYLYCSVKDSFVVHPGNRVDIFFRIDEGRPFLLKEITVNGAESLSEKKIISLINHKIGRPYNPIQIRNGIKAITTEYANIGKPLATVNDSLSVEDNIHLFLIINESHTMHVNQVSIINNKLVKLKPIRRELVVKPGDLYSLKKIDLSKRHIYETGLFSGVNIRLADIDTIQNQVNLIVDVRELDMHYLGLDVGFGQDRGLTDKSEYISIDVTGEWLNRNITGRGSRLSLKAETALNLIAILSQKRISTEISWIEPWLLGFRSSNSFTLFAKHQVFGEDDDIRALTNYGGETALIYQPERRLYLKTGLAMQRVISYMQSDTTKDFERAITLTFRRDFRDNFLFPKDGTLFTMEGKVGSVIGNAADYYKLETSFCQYLDIFGPFVLAYRAKFGLVNPIEQSKDPPDYEKFYLGGSTSMRGWGDDLFIYSIDSTDTEYKNHLPVGENLKIMTNVEIRFPLFWRLGGEIFVDGGNLVSDFKALKNTTYRWDAGIGLTLATPLGPFRIDYAKRLNENKNIWKFQFGIPYAF